MGGGKNFLQNYIDIYIDIHCSPPIVVLGRKSGNFGRPETNTALNLLQKINQLKRKNVIDFQCMNARSSLTLFHLLHINRITWKKTMPTLKISQNQG